MSPIRSGRGCEVDVRGPLDDAASRIETGTVTQAVQVRSTGFQHGELSPQAIISHRTALSDAAAGYEVFNEELEDCRKVVLIPR